MPIGVDPRGSWLGKTWDYSNMMGHGILTFGHIPSPARKEQIFIDVDGFMHGINSTMVFFLFIACPRYASFLFTCQVTTSQVRGRSRCLSRCLYLPIISRT
jgi:hypothetical protein